MLRLIKKDLTEQEKKGLETLQARIDTEPDFTTKAAAAKSFWAYKGGKEGEQLFQTIKTYLLEMCVGTEVCNYCEGNEANDIEHIYPKSFFPEMTFVWDNYLLACKQCNSGYKLDKCFVLDHSGNVHQTARGIEPPYSVIAMINPRIEDPNTFILLNVEIWEFEIHPNLSLQDQHKAEKTLEILQLNNRDYLKAGRRAAASEYYNLMDRLCRITNAANMEGIKKVLSPDQDEIMSRIDKHLSLDEIKKAIQEHVKTHIQKHRHPSVWYAIKKISSKTNTQWQRVFQTIPEALTW
jgi:uncharacterized protein (TIGR02646 family)